MFDYAANIKYDDVLKCWYLMKDGKRKDLIAYGFQEAVIECEILKL
jgi:hypothetical protein